LPLESGSGAGKLVRRDDHESDPGTVGSVPAGRGSTMPDRICEAAQGRLRGSPYFVFRDIDCVYRDGVLTLHGCLPSNYLKQMAQACVADIAGVRAVANHIEVTAPRSRGAVAP